MTRLTLVLISLVFFTSCSGGDDEQQQASMDEVVHDIEQLDVVTKTVRLTEETDLEEMLGRSDGYDHAAIFFDSRLTCQVADLDCGAMLEVWDDHDEATFRAEDIKARQTGMEFLGNQHVYVDGRMVLRVSAELTSSQAEKYRDALLG